MITMLLGGLWHGANWTFVVWGALHGCYLCIERLFRPKKAPTDVSAAPELIPSPEPVPVTVSASFVPTFFRTKSTKNFFTALLTFFLINVTWVFFRSPDFTTAWRLLTSMFTRVSNGAPLLPTIDMIKVSVVIVLMVITHWFMRNTTVLEVAQKTKWWIVGIVWAVMLLFLILSQASSSSFIYFQF
jgi:D-alanyl-lipoteichoic acid acyltransferase DltB (MBOAT superfamily)